MKEFRIGQHRHDLGNQMWQEQGDPFSGTSNTHFQRSIIHVYKRVPNFNELVHQRAQELEVKGFRTLNAHGGTNENGEWVFADDPGRYYNVQEWVSRYDGRALALMILVCNPDDIELSAKRSLVIHPRDDVSMAHIVLDPGALRVMDPDKGYLC